MPTDKTNSNAIVIGKGNPALLEAGTPSRYDTLSQAIEQAKRNLQREFLGDGDPDPYGYADELEKESGADLLPVNWKARPDDSLHVKRQKARARRTAVARFYLMGLGPKQIAMKCKVNEATIYDDLH